MPFSKYDEGYIHDVKRAVESTGRRIRNRSDLEYYVLLSLLTETVPGAFWLAIRELFHFGLSHKTYYVSSELRSALLDSSYLLGLDDMMSLRFPHPSFDVAIEPFKIDGKTLSGFMIIPPMVDASFSAFKSIFDKVTAMRSSTNVNNLWLRDMKSSLSVSYWINNKRYTACANFAAMQGRINVIEAINMALSSYGREQDINIVQTYARLALGIMLYSGSEGAERKAIITQTSRAFGSENAELLGETFQRGPNWHMRRACFHVLSDPRFKRNDDGTPRRIWVRTCEVGKGRPMCFPVERSEFLQEAGL